MAGLGPAIAATGVSGTASASSYSSAVSVTAPLAAGSTICVGLVIDPRAIGGTVSATCVNVRPGTTGVGVLEAAGHSVTFRKDGLLCTIDGLPDSGCSGVNDSHYWVYYHRAPDRTGWTYATENESIYAPASRSTEGWVYDNGANPAPKPQDIPAAQICAGLLKPAAASTPAKPAASTTPHRTAKPRGSSTAAPATSATPTTPRPHRQPSRATSASPKAGGTQAGTSTSPPLSPSPTAAAARDSGSSGNGSAVGAVIAGVVIVVLIAGAVIGTRRRRP